MKLTVVLSFVGVMCLAAGANADLVVGDRILIDVGAGWTDPGYPGFGLTGDTQTVCTGSGGGPGDIVCPDDGNWWNNLFSNGTPTIELCTTANNTPTGVTLNRSGWAGCGDGGGHAVPQDPQSNLYPVKAQTDLRWWPASKQPAVLTFANLPTDLIYNVRLFSYVDSDAGPSEGGDFASGTARYSCDSVYDDVNPVDNTTDKAELLGLSPEADGSLVVEIVGINPLDCDVFLNVIDLTAVPEPATMLLLAVGGGLLALRRRR